MKHHWRGVAVRVGWWIIGRLVRDAVPVDGMLWVDLAASRSRLED
jgi:hypothetical protein